MKLKFVKVVIGICIILTLFISHSYFQIDAINTEYNFSYTYNEKTYYSNESEDDAWYQAMLDNYEQGLLTEEEIKEEYDNFSNRDIIEEIEIDESDVITNSINSASSDESTKLFGRLCWETEKDYIIPLKYMRVDLYDTSSIIPSYLTTTYTDVYGNYSFELENFTEPIYSGKFKVCIKFYPDSYTFEIARDWLFTFLTYYSIKPQRTITIKEGTYKFYNYTIEYNPNNLTNCSFYLSQGFVTSQRFAMDMGMETDKFLHVLYPFKEEQTAFCYDKFAGIAKVDFNNFDTAMHEYGHFVEGALGNYGSTLLEIIINDPTHYLNTDNFKEKNSENFAMELTWSESWATVFAQIAQQKYLSEYSERLENDTTIIKLNYYGDLLDEDNDYNNIETFSPNSNSCEAQEIAVIASLWDMFDETNETYDKMNLSYEEWWKVTAVNKTSNGTNIKTLSDFFDSINKHRPNYRNMIGEIFGVHQIAPSNFTLINSNEVSKEVPPKFSWTVNGSINYPNNKFKIVFYYENNSKFSETEIITIDSLKDEEGNSITSLDYNQTVTYQVSTEVWAELLTKYINTNIAKMRIVVEGFHSYKVTSGPYNSKYIFLDVMIGDHICDYTYNYEKYSSLQHKSYCECGNYVLHYHVVSASSTSRYKQCIECGYYVDTGKDFSLIGPTSVNTKLVSNNGSYVLESGIIVLVDDDIVAYYNNTLVFYYKKEELF